MSELKQKAIALDPHYPRSDIEARISWAFDPYKENGLVYLGFQASGLATTVNISESDAVKLAHFILDNIEKKAPKGTITKGAF